MEHHKPKKYIYIYYIIIYTSNYLYYHTWLLMDTFWNSEGKEANVRLLGTSYSGAILERLDSLPLTLLQIPPVDNELIELLGVTCIFSGLGTS